MSSVPCQLLGTRWCTSKPRRRPHPVTRHLASRNRTARRTFHESAGALFPIARTAPSWSTSTGVIDALARSCSNSESAIGTRRSPPGPPTGPRPGCPPTSPTTASACRPPPVDHTARPPAVLTLRADHLATTRLQPRGRMVRSSSTNTSNMHRSNHMGMTVIGRIAVVKPTGTRFERWLVRRAR